jgi:hypothetical protein
MSLIQRRQGHFKLYAYVCGTACVEKPDVDGTVTFLMVFMKRPQHCRYAVVGEWDVATHSERILVFDMFEAKIRGAATLITPEPKAVFDDVDQAIMATMLMYEQD